MTKKQTSVFQHFVLIPTKKIKSASIFHPPETLSEKLKPPIYFAIGILMTTKLAKNYALSMAEKGPPVYVIDYQDDLIGYSSKNKKEKPFANPEFRAETLEKALNPNLIQKLGKAGTELLEQIDKEGLNLHGYSRGGMDIVKLAKKLEQNNREIKINGILLENTAGICPKNPLLIPAQFCKISKNIHKGVPLKKLLPVLWETTKNAPHPQSIVADLVAQKTILKEMKWLQERGIPIVVMQNQWDELFNCMEMETLLRDNFPFIQVHGKNGHTSLIQDPQKDQHIRILINQFFTAKNKEQAKAIWETISQKLKKIPTKNGNECILQEQESIIEDVKIILKKITENYSQKILNWLLPNNEKKQTI